MMGKGKKPDPGTSTSSRSLESRHAAAHQPAGNSYNYTGKHDAAKRDGPRMVTKTYLDAEAWRRPVPTSLDEITMDHPELVLNWLLDNGYHVPNPVLTTSNREDANESDDTNEDAEALDAASQSSSTSKRSKKAVVVAPLVEDKPKTLTTLKGGRFGSFHFPHEKWESFFEIYSIALRIQEEALRSGPEYGLSVEPMFFNQIVDKSERTTRLVIDVDLNGCPYPSRTFSEPAVQRQYERCFVMRMTQVFQAVAYDFFDLPSSSQQLLVLPATTHDDDDYFSNDDLFHPTAIDVGGSFEIENDADRQWVAEYRQAMASNHADEASLRMRRERLHRYSRTLTPKSRQWPEPTFRRLPVHDNIVLVTTPEASKRTDLVGSIEHALNARKLVSWKPQLMDRALCMQELMAANPDAASPVLWPLGDRGGDVLSSQSSTPITVQKGYHVHFPGIVIDRLDTIRIKEFLGMCAVELERALPRDAVRRHENPWAEAIDVGPTLKGTLRCLGSNKTSKCKVCMLWPSLPSTMCPGCYGRGKYDDGRPYRLAYVHDGWSMNSSIRTSLYEHSMDLLLMTSLHVGRGDMQLCATDRSGQPIVLRSKLTSIRARYGVDTHASVDMTRIAGQLLGAQTLPGLVGTSVFSRPDRRVLAADVAAEKDVSNDCRYVLTADDSVLETLRLLVRTKMSSEYSMVELAKVKTNHLRTIYFVTLTGPGSSYCMYEQRVHRSNTVYAYLTGPRRREVTNDAGVVSLRCFDPECQRQHKTTWTSWPIESVYRDELWSRPQEDLETTKAADREKRQRESTNGSLSTHELIAQQRNMIAAADAIES